MLYANLLMFCSSSTASQCCSLQSLSFTGFLTGYFIACHYHSLWLYGLCSPLARSPDAAAPTCSPLPLFCRRDQPSSTSFISSLLPQVPRIPPSTGACRVGECNFGSWMSSWFKLNVFYRWLFRRVNVKYEMHNTLCFGRFDNSQAFFIMLMCIWRKLQCFIQMT